MFLIGQSNKIRWSIVRANTVKMVYHPSLRYSLSMRLFPYKSMFCNTAIRNCIRMVRSINSNITFVSPRTTSFYVKRICSFTSPPSFCATTMASCRFSVYFLTAVWTQVWGFSRKVSSICTSFRGTASASFSLPIAELSAIRAGVSE